MGAFYLFFLCDCCDKDFQWCWTEVVTISVFVFFQILVGKPSAFHCWVLCWLWVSDSFYYAEICSLYTHFSESIYHEWMLNFTKYFFCIYWNDYLVSVFSFVDVIYHIDCFAYVYHYCGPGVNPTWPQRMTLCWGRLHLYASMILACNFPFLYYLCLVLVSGRWWLHRMTLGMFPPLQSLGWVCQGLV